MAFLELTHVEAFYGKIRALKGIDLNVEQGEIVTLIGANGAGKSTTLKAISGLMKLGPEANLPSQSRLRRDSSPRGGEPSRRGGNGKGTSGFPEVPV